MEPEMQELLARFDKLSEQVTYLTEQAALAERQRADRAELMRDLTPIVDQAFDLTVRQLEEIQEYVDLSDLLRLIKRILRNGRNFEQMLSQLEGLLDLVDTAGPLADEAFGKAVDVLSGMERKGYFAAARGGARIVDNVVTSFGEDDIRRLGDNIVLILNTVKEMTQPEILNFVRNTLMVAESEVQKPVDTSWFGLIRMTQDPAVRRGLALTMRVLHVVGEQAGTNGRGPHPEIATA